MVDAAQLTAEQQTHQLGLRAGVLVQLQKLWPMFRPADFSTFDDFTQVAGGIVLAGNRKSADIASDYLSRMAQTETGSIGMPPVVAPAPSLRVIATNLRANGLLGTLNALRAGQTPADAAANGWVRTAGMASSFVLHGGRDTVMATVKADPRIVRWRRVSMGRPCDFCAMLISRGAVYKQRTVDFRTHDHCACIPQPEYQPLSASSALYERSWPTGQKSADAFKTFQARIHEGEVAPVKPIPMGPAPVPAPVKPGSVDVSRYGATGPGGMTHALDGALNAAHADLLKYAPQHNALQAELNAAREAHGWNSPEYQHAMSKRQVLDGEWQSVMAEHGAALAARRKVQLDDLQAAHLTPEEGMKIKAQLEAEVRWQNMQLARVPEDLRLGPADVARVHWQAVVGKAGAFRMEMSQAATKGLPLRQRLHELSPADLLGGKGSGALIGKGKAYEALHETWSQTADMADWVETKFGWNTYWTGTVRGVAGRGAAGVAGWDNSIGLQPDVWKAAKGTNPRILGGYDVQARAKVALHELFHLQSGGGVRLTPSAYVRHQGWEEGTVERCAQVWEREATEAAGLTWNGGAFRTYEKFTNRLEKMRTILGQDEEHFYTGLIRTPAEDRRAKVESWGDQAHLTPDQDDELKQLTRALSGRSF